MRFKQGLSFGLAICCAASVVIFIGAPVGLRPANPKHITATSASSNSVNVSWTHNGKRTKGFSIARRRAEPGYAFQMIASVGASDRSFLDESAQSRTQYVYTVTALGKVLNSKRVSSKRVTTPEGAPQTNEGSSDDSQEESPQITDPTLEESIEDEVELTWTSADSSSTMRSASVVSGNLVSNSGVETNPYLSFNYYGYPGLEWTAPARTGAYSLGFNFSNYYYPNHQSTVFHPTWKTTDKISVSPGAKYRASVYMRAEELANGFSLIAYYRSDTGKLSTTTKIANVSASDPIVGTEQWKQVTVDLSSAPATAKYISVEFQLAGGGHVFVDDLSIINLTAGTPVLLNNPSFETSPFANYLPSEWSGGGFNWSSSGRSGRGLAINFPATNFPILAGSQSPLHWKTKIPATPGVSYAVSLWGYVTEAAVPVGITANYRLLDGKISGGTGAEIPIESLDTWTKMSFTLPPAPSNVQQIEFRFGSRGATMVWFDDLEVQAVTGGSACPTKIRIESTAQSDLDGGWTGNSHDSKLSAGINTVMTVNSCQGTTSPGCGECSVTGPIVDPSGPNTRRCLGNSSVFCSTDAECSAAGLGTCEFFAGGPLPTVSGGVAGCVVSRWIGTLSGTVNLDSGRLNLPTFDMKSTIFTNGTATSPCPVCMGDPTFRDGVRGGTCVNGGRVGLPCDVDSVHPWFDANTANGHSLDCPPAIAGAGGLQDVAGAGTLDLKLGPYTTDPLSWELSSASPTCRGQTAYKCFCETCNNAESTPCRTSADCPMSGGQPGICGGKRCMGGTRNGLPCTIASDPVTGCPNGGLCNRPGNPPQSNSCIGESDGEIVDRCVMRTDGDGQCANGPIVSHCNLKPWVGCSNPQDCVNTNAGTECIADNQLCYVDNGTLNPLIKVSTDGFAAPFDANGIANVKIGTLFCFGVTGSAAVNNAVGLPGLGRIEQNVKLVTIP